MSVALVLAGGGVTGVAWETGVLLGLRDAGVDLVAAADVVLGTSAGSVVGAQVLSGVDLAELYERQLRDDHRELTPTFDFEVLVAIFSDLANGRLPDTAARVRIGAIAVAAPTVDEEQRRAVIEWRLPSHEWPVQRLLVTAVDASSGEVAIFDIASGVDLVDAVAASCAVPGIWPPVTIGDRRFIDGGVRSTVNADLVSDHDTLVVLAPLSGPGGASLDRELDALRARGASVTVIAADEAATQAMGANPLDPSYRRPAAEHGRRQGAASAAKVAAPI